MNGVALFAVSLILYGWILANKVACRASPVVTVGRRDAAVECTGTYSQRVTQGLARQVAPAQWKKNSFVSNHKE